MADFIIPAKGHRARRVYHLYPRWFRIWFSGYHRRDGVQVVLGGRSPPNTTESFPL